MVVESFAFEIFTVAILIANAIQIQHLKDEIKEMRSVIVIKKTARIKNF